MSRAARRLGRCSGCSVNGTNCLGLFLIKCDRMISRRTRRVPCGPGVGKIGYSCGCQIARSKVFVSRRS